jgi:hypothetical protein
MWMSLVAIDNSHVSGILSSVSGKAALLCYPTKEEVIADMNDSSFRLSAAASLLNIG